MKRNESADVIRVSGEDDCYYLMSEKAERRVCWVMTGILAMAIMPVFILAFAG